MKLAEFISANLEPILMEWEVFARGIAPASDLDALALRDHAEEILRATVQDMGSPQTSPQRAARAKGQQPAIKGYELNGASELHAIDRLGHGFDLLEVVSEYRALRASVLELWAASSPERSDQDVEELTRFNESIDQSLVKAVTSYTRRVDQSRDLFLAILSHDLRNPLNAIATSAALLPHLQRAAESAQTAAQISTSAALMGRMISDLLDYTRTRLGAGMPVSPRPMDLAAMCREIYEEFRSGFPERSFQFESVTELNGSWDPDRMRQAVSNVLGNAVQHGVPDRPVKMVVKTDGDSVLIAIQNGGPPIPPGEMSKIFEPLVRGSSAGGPPKNRPGSIGLGLYIAREIAHSHHGHIDVVSTQEEGTTFIIRLPRDGPTQDGAPILDQPHVQSM